MLKKITIFSFSILFFVGCDKATQPSANANVGAPEKASNSLVISGHSQQSAGNSSVAPPTGQPVQKSAGKTKWTQSGSPIDTSSLDREIAKAEKDFSAKPKDAAARTALAAAFFKRGVALTQAAQYASALGDYRSVLKHDADNQEAKTWIGEIIKIYDSINREAPKAGEEPPPLPFEKKS